MTRTTARSNGVGMAPPESARVGYFASFSLSSSGLRIPQPCALLQERGTAPPPYPLALFRDHPTSNAVPRVSCGIGLIVVGLRVHHDRRTVGQQRMRAVLERDIGILQLSLRLAVGSYREILHVAGMMSFGIVESML